MEFFVSAETGLAMNSSGLPMTECGDDGASFCKLLPPIIEDEKEIESIHTASDNVQTSMKAITFSNLFLSIVFGGMT